MDQSSLYFIKSLNILLSFSITGTNSCVQAGGRVVSAAVDAFVPSSKMKKG